VLWEWSLPRGHSTGKEEVRADVAPRPHLRAAAYQDADDIRAATQGAGRDMVLCRPSGFDLDKTGVIAGMGGSPVYIDGKLLRNCLHARIFIYPLDDIVGVTPFRQMNDCVEEFERLDIFVRAPCKKGGGVE